VFPRRDDTGLKSCFRSPGKPAGTESDTFDFPGRGAFQKIRQSNCGHNRVESLAELVSARRLECARPSTQRLALKLYFPGETILFDMNRKPVSTIGRFDDSLFLALTRI
jgi:hypothetical protein